MPESSQPSQAASSSGPASAVDISLLCLREERAECWRKLRSLTSDADSELIAERCRERIARIDEMLDELSQFSNDKSPHRA
jgi:hypothetical protein